MEKIVPFSLAQERLIFLDQIVSNKFLFNVPIALSIRGAVDSTNLNLAFNDLIERHEILRMIVKNQDNHIVGIIQDKPDFKLKVTKLCNKDKYDINKWVYNKAFQDFDLINNFLIKAELLVIDEQSSILIILLHHIVTDEWSSDILLRDLSYFYQEKINGNKNSLPKLTIQYSDYARWQKDLIDKNYFKSQQEYWLRKLKDAPELISLPYDKSRSREISYEGSSYKLNFSYEILVRLKQYSTEKRVTLFTVLFAIFNIFLHYYAETDDIVIGYPIANRLTTEVENLIGFFVNIVPFRSFLNPDITFEEFLYETKNNLLEGYENQALPFDQIVKVLNITRDQSYHPVFQVLCTLHSNYDEKLDFSGLNVQEIELPDKSSKFDFSLFFNETSQGLELKFIYNKNLFLEKSIIFMAIAIKHVTEKILSFDKIKIRDIGLIDQSFCLENLKTRGPQKDLSSMLEKGILGFFSKQVTTNPEAAAIIAPNQSLTYKELNLLSNQVANLLLENGLSNGEIVAVLLDSSIDFIISIIGILKAGAVYMPIDINIPIKRLKYILNDSKTKFILTKNFNINNEDPSTSVCLNFTDAYNCSSTRNTNYFNKNNCMCVIYTSGSTGFPKGVLYKQSSVINRISWVWENYPFEQKEQCVLLANLTFVDSIWEIFGPLLAGVSLIIPSQLIATHPESLITLINKYNIFRIGLLPSLLSLLMDEVDNLSEAVPNLKHLEISGENFSDALVERVLSKSKNLKLINRYGSTEATSVIYNELSLDGEIKSKVIIETKILANTAIYIADKYNNLLPCNMKGYLFVSGEPVAIGYLNDENLTKESFFSNLFCHNLSSQTYKTGDLAKYSEDGTIYLLGRKDKQIKINGNRIYLEEIELVLNKCSSVKESKILILDENAIKTIVAYIILNKERDSIEIESQISQYLIDNLPSYMVPKKIVFIEKFPLNANNKIDIEKLKEFQENKYKLETKSSLPRNYKEYKLLKIWESTLGKKISIYDNFFGAGGSSLMLFRLISSMQKELKVKLLITDIYKYPTISEMAYNLGSVKNDFDDSILIPINQNGEEPPLFLVHTALGLSFPYLVLSNYINNIPIYGINDPDMNASLSFSLDSIEKMADFYIKSIKKIQPYGPYRLGGWSFGGHVALEISKQLKQTGEKVEVVFLFDSSNYTEKNIKNVDNDLLIEFLTDLNINPNSNDAKLIEFEVKKCITLMKKYKHSFYNGRVVLVKSQGDELSTDFRAKDVFQGWEEILDRNLEIYSAPGMHHEIFNPEYVKYVVAIINFALKESESALILKDKNLSILDANLHFAAQNSDKFMIDRLIKFGANPNSKDSAGKSFKEKFEILRSENIE